MGGLFGNESTTDLQIEIIDEQIAEVKENPELSEPQKEREIKHLELAKAQVIDSAQRSGMDVENFERDGDFFSD